MFYFFILINNRSTHYFNCLCLFLENSFNNIFPHDCFRTFINCSKTWKEYHEDKEILNVVFYMILASVIS